MIRSARVSNAERGHSEIPEWLHPRLKYGRHGFVALQVYTSNGTGTVVHIEISGEFRVVGLQFHILAIGKMLRDVSARAEKAFLFTSPEAQSNRPAHFEAGRLQDAKCFHHHGRSGGIVCCACSRVPGVEVRPDHHEFVRLIRPRNFGYDVERVQVLVVELVLDVHFKTDRDFLFDHPPDASVVLYRHDNL